MLLLIMHMQQKNTLRSVCSGLSATQSPSPELCAKYNTQMLLVVLLRVQTARRVSICRRPRGVRGRRHVPRCSALARIQQRGSTVGRRRCTHNRCQLLSQSRILPSPPSSRYAALIQRCQYHRLTAAAALHSCSVKTMSFGTMPRACNTAAAHIGCQQQGGRSWPQDCE